MKLFLLLSIVSSIKAQQSIVLQFIGDQLSQEEATNRELCDTKYCLSDAQTLFYAATQNKSVRPCDDFQEFALGTFDKYNHVNDRSKYTGFLSDVSNIFLQRLRRVLSEPVIEKDSRMSKGVKRFFSKCVNSKYITKNGVREAREYARSIGLKFYPETNDKDFNLKNHIEEQMTNSLRRLFYREISYDDDDNPMDLYLNSFRGNKNFELQLVGYETMLYDMNQIYRNSSYSEEFTKEFKEIANKQVEFYHRLKNATSTGEEEDSIKLMTIKELNNLTSSLNLNWLTIINNQLSTKVNSSAKIFVVEPLGIAETAKFLAESDKDAVADYLVYDFLTDNIAALLVYADSSYRSTRIGSKRPLERWNLCIKTILVYLTPVFDALFLQRYFDKETEKSIRQLVNETIEFALKKVKVENRWGEEVRDDISERLQSVKFIFGYSEEIVTPEMLEELYGDLDFEQNFIKVLHEVHHVHKRLKRELRTRQLLTLLQPAVYTLTYRPTQNIFFVDSRFLNYPFYHTERPRYFNTATLSNLIFISLKNELKFTYVRDKYKIDNFTFFDDAPQLGYEFYESWLNSGGEELNLGANRLTNQQLYWMAIARTRFKKYQLGFAVPNQAKYVLEFNKFITSNPGFSEAFDCKKID